MFWFCVNCGWKIMEVTAYLVSSFRKVPTLSFLATGIIDLPILDSWDVIGEEGCKFSLILPGPEVSGADDDLINFRFCR